MATNKTILKNTENEVVYKLSGAGTTTIALNSGDILAPTQVVDGSTQKVDITGFTWTGASDGLITIVRNSVVIATCPAASSNFLDLAGQMMPADSTENTSPIVVTITGQAELWLRIRKKSGYKSKIELAEYSQYDDPTVAGS